MKPPVHHSEAPRPTRARRMAERRECLAREHREQLEHRGQLDMFDRAAKGDIDVTESSPGRRAPEPAPKTPQVAQVAPSRSTRSRPTLDEIRERPWLVFE